MIFWNFLLGLLCIYECARGSVAAGWEMGMFLMSLKPDAMCFLGCSRVCPCMPPCSLFSQRVLHNCNGIPDTAEKEKAGKRKP